MRKITASVLAAVLVLATLFTAVACANPGGKPGTTTAPVDNNVTGDANSKTDLPTTLNFSELDDAQKTVTFVFNEGGEYTFTERSIKLEDTGDLDKVDTAIFNRNQKVEAWLGVTIESIKATDSISGLESEIGNALASGTGDYDVICGYQYYTLDMATKGYLKNYRNLTDADGTRVDYIDLTKSYWAGNYIDALSYKNCTYWVTGDLALRLIGGMYCTYVNAKLYTDMLQATYGSIYDIVKNGEWTLDKLCEMVALVYNDTNSNDQVDKDDIVGFAYETNDSIDGMAFGSKVPFSTRATDGSVSITMNSDTTLSFVKLLEKLLDDCNCLNCGDSDSTIVMPQFASGNVAFTINKLFQAQQYLTDMSDDYYIIPVPKLDTKQPTYVTGVHDGCTIYGINYASDCIPAAAATLELMAYYGSVDVVPEYYNSALKYGYTRDSASAEMIDIIHANVNTDFVAAWSESLNNIVHYFRSSHNSGKLQSSLKRAQKTWDTALEKLIADLEAYVEE